MMKKIVILLVILSGIVSNYISNADDNINDAIENLAYDSRTIEEIGSWRYTSNIENRSLRLNNNVWGLTDEEKETKRVKLYIYYKFNGNFGWEWERPDPGPEALGIYPEVTIGTAPYIDVGFSQSTTPYLPIQLKDIKNMTSEVDYIYVKSPTGDFNLAYDIWLIEPPSMKKAEIMIWVQGDLGEDYQNVISDGNNMYKYYYRENGTWEFPWDYHAFILENQVPASSALSHYDVNIKKLIDWLYQKEKLTSEWILPVMSFGNEVWRGSGKIEIYKFSVKINGDDI